MKVAVLDTNKRVLAPCSPRRARHLLSTGKAAVLKRYPFTIILKREVTDVVTPELRVKVDPGSKVTGLAIVNQATGEVIFGAELHHRGQAIKASLDSRRSLRRSRRNRKTRYRKPRFLNRVRSQAKGWLAPSLTHRVDTTLTWVNRLRNAYPISAISMELVRFDTQLMENAEISGAEYQQGELAGYEVREYLLEKFGRKCCYCDCKDVPLQVEHINPKARGGTNRVTNLCLACQKCNQRKGALTAAEFGYPEIQAQARKPLKDATAVNATRWRLFNELQATGLPVECGTGGLTKFNRSRLGIKKAHWLDAACVGKSTPDSLNVGNVTPLTIKATGYGSRQMCRTDKYGFPMAHKTRNKTFLGYRTGDMVQASVPRGKFAGIHVGRITIRQRASFILNGCDVHPKYLIRFQRGDGYAYSVSAK